MKMNDTYVGETSPLLLSGRRPSPAQRTKSAPVTTGEESPLFHPHHAAMTSRRFEVSSAMNRLRSSMVGETSSILASLPLESGPGQQKGKQRDPESQADSTSSRLKPKQKGQLGWLSRALGQVPAIALIGMFHLMIGVPFGVSYFPLYWSSTGDNFDQDSDEEAKGLGGQFPLPGKEALGIRMFLFSTIIGQIVFTATSGFSNPIGLQMVENVAFCHALSAIVIRRQGHGLEALSTLVVMFGLASVVVGLVFFVLGEFKLGRIVYFFPTHVLIGCIGGIGVFIAKTGIEVTIDEAFSVASVMDKFHLFRVVLLFEVVLRVLEQVTKDANGKAKYTLLSPIYFCLITPVFYATLAVFHVPISEAEETGYFFPRLDKAETGDQQAVGLWSSILGDEHLWDMWAVVDFKTVSWGAIWDATPTLVALTLFSLIHVPINIPAFALSTNTEADMNNELKAHGYSNIIAGLLGGLQNYLAYTQSVLYDKSGGTGKPSGFAVAVVTAVLFFVGPTIASFIPRCMAGTLLLHVGIDLFLEGVLDSWGKFDALEYSGIWLIVCVMTLYGMEAAMVAGVIAAVSTYAVQSVAYLSPIRGHMPATTLRSSRRSRDYHAQAILSSSTDGRSRILVVQLQGHLFFGNMAHLNSSFDSLLTNKDDLAPIVVIVDCSLVLGIDSSAAQALTKLKDAMLTKHQVKLCIFVTGSNEGFPTEFKLSDQLSCTPEPSTGGLEQVEEDAVLTTVLGGASKGPNAFAGSRVYFSLDQALILAEDALISRKDPTLLSNKDEMNLSTRFLSLFESSKDPHNDFTLLEDEKELFVHYLRNICPVHMTEGDPEYLFSLFDREVYKEGEYVWKQHSSSDSVKLLIFGMLIAELEEEAGTTETISTGNTIGETGLVNNEPRMSSVRCLSREAIAYSMNRPVWETLIIEHPRIARYIDLICINYLQNRVQHVSNRIFETRCLPI